ncbi:MAG: copper-containing nitrite reductase [Parcubacteria bacterium OLB19]|nr:MAG: copper-containing nitrite reductase [Parcubacteria bacterium OLB19]
MDLRKLSMVLALAFGIISLLTVILIIYLGGDELLSYLRPTLIQGFGLGIAVTAALFFFLRLVYKLHAMSMALAMLFFFIGVVMFMSVSVSRMYVLQYPVFVQSFGPGHGPGLPVKNVITFFQRIDEFERVGDIARDPNDVPSPIVVKEVENNKTMLNNDMGSTTSTSTLEVAPNEMVVSGIADMVNNGALLPVSSHEVEMSQGEVRELKLETTEILSEIAPGIIFNYWTFNNTVPGPLFRVSEGDMVKVTIHNRATNLHNHNVDFHAATGPGGGGAVSVVAPGETKEFYFKALNPGLYVYHCAVPNMAVHMAHGMYGMILVEPKEGLPKVDKEFYVMQGELYTTGTIGRQGLQIFDAQKMMDGIPEYITFNGRTGGVTGKMQAKVGDTVRFYVGNGGVAHNSSFHIVGEIFDTVYPEGSMGGALFHNVQTTNVPAGGSSIVEFKVDYPGKYVLVDHALMRTDKGAWGILEVVGEKDDTIFGGNFSAPANSSH